MIYVSIGSIIFFSFISTTILLYIFTNKFKISISLSLFETIMAIFMLYQNNILYYLVGLTVMLIVGIVVLSKYKVEEANK